MGYRIGQGDHVDSAEAVITFVTVGYALQLLSHNPARLSKYTHLILDEVHERTMEGDLLSLLMKKLMQRTRCKTKLVVMSATLQEGLFGEYFAKEKNIPIPPPIFVGARRYPVQEIFLNEMSAGVLPAPSQIRELMRTFAKMVKKQEDSGGTITRYPAEFAVEAETVMVSLILHLAQPDSCILCFLPGIGEISGVQDALEQCPSTVPLQILVLHSLVPREEQEAAVLPAQQGSCKVILSTNIAQTSVTIPDVRFVIGKHLLQISTPSRSEFQCRYQYVSEFFGGLTLLHFTDSGVQRSVFYDDERRIQSLLCTWCSQVLRCMFWP